MADQIYNLTQTGAEVQAIINDANNAKGAGATTSLSTDYIMLKDTSGQYHKIQKDSFTEAVRNTLASLLVNNDKGTTISQIAAIASGDFGSVTPANLASVLGDVSTTTETDFNNIPTGKWYFYNLTGKTNYPSQATVGGVLLSTLTTQGMSYQYYHENNTNAIYYRSRWYNNNWSSWSRIDNYGTTSLEGLASALGALFGKKLTDIGSAATLYDFGFYNVDMGDTYEQYDIPFGYGVLIVFPSGTGGGTYIVQLFISREGSAVDNLYIRTGTRNAGFRSWKPV